MKAAVYYKYGSPNNISIAEIAKPVPKDDEVLVKIHSASINARDWRMLRGKPFVVRFINGLVKPKNILLGADIAGTIETAGNSIIRFKHGRHRFMGVFHLVEGVLSGSMLVRKKVYSHQCQPT